MATSTIPDMTASSTDMIGASSTLPFVRHEDWNATLIADIRFSHPGTATPADPKSEEARQGLVTTIDLGTAIQDPGTKSVPKRTLKVRRLLRTDPLLAPCSENEVGQQGIRAVKMVRNRARQSFCVRSSADAGAGNLYDTRSYVLMTAAGGYEFAFTTHSVQCLNFPRPQEQCVPFEEVRDTALFEEIMGSLTVNGGGMEF